MCTITMYTKGSGCFLDAVVYFLGSYLCSSLFISCCSIDLTSQKKALCAFHLQCRTQLSGTHKIVLHTVTCKKMQKYLRQNKPPSSARQFSCRDAYAPGV